MCWSEWLYNYWIEGLLWLRTFSPLIASGYFKHPSSLSSSLASELIEDTNSLCPKIAPQQNLEATYNIWQFALSSGPNMDKIPFCEDDGHAPLPTRPRTTFPFAKLPQELKILIFDHFMPDNGSSTSNSKHGRTVLLSLNQEHYALFGPHFYQHAVFSFDDPFRFQEEFLESASSVCLNNLRNLCFNVDTSLDEPFHSGLRPYDRESGQEGYTVARMFRYLATIINLYHELKHLHRFRINLFGARLLRQGTRIIPSQVELSSKVIDGSGCYPLWNSTGLLPEIVELYTEFQDRVLKDTLKGFIVHASLAILYQPTGLQELTVTFTRPATD